MRTYTSLDKKCFQKFYNQATAMPPKVEEQIFEEEVITKSFGRSNSDGAKMAVLLEQKEITGKINYCCQKQEIEAGRPGALLVQDVFGLGNLNGVGEVYLHAVIDTCGLFAFGCLHTTKAPECAIALVHNQVLPFYQEKGIFVGCILADDNFCGEETRLYKLYLALLDIKHKNKGNDWPNSVVERFASMVIAEFFRNIFQEKCYTTLAALQKDLSQWLYDYNYGRSHLGYHNFEKRPIEYIENYITLLHGKKIGWQNEKK